MAAEAPPVKKRIFRLVLGLSLLLVLGLGAGGYWYYFLRGKVTSDDARIDGDLVDLSAELGGTLDQVLVQEGDEVSKGQLLFKLDRTLLEASQAQAKAEVLSAQAALAAAEARSQKAKHGPRSEEIRMAEQAAKRAEAQAKLAEADWQRTKKLLDTKSVPEAVAEKSQTSWETSIHAKQEAADRLHLLLRGTRSEDRAAAEAAVAAAQARLKAAEAAVHQVEIKLGYTEVRAPFAGLVARRWRDPGVVLGPGAPVITLMNPATLHVAANIEEKYLSEVAIGAPVAIEVDAFPHHELHGRLSRIVRATNSKFSLIPAEGVSGTFIKVSQRVPLWIEFDSPPDLPLGPGLSAEITIQAQTPRQTRPLAAQRK